MKLIDLANKIYNKEELPKKIKCCNDIYEYNQEKNEYQNVYVHSCELFDDNSIDINELLNNDVETPEDKKTQIEEINNKTIELIDKTIEQLKDYKEELIKKREEN